MRAAHLFVNTSIIFTLLLSGCGAVNDVKDAENMKKEADLLQDLVKAEQKSMDKEEGIMVDSGAVRTLDSSIFPWGQKSAEKRASLRVRLNNFISAINRIFEIKSHKSMKVEGNLDDYRMARDNARLYLESLDKYEKAGGIVEPQPDQTDQGEPSEEDKPKNGNRRPWDEDEE